MDVFIQYLEGPQSIIGSTPRQVQARLRAAFGVIPFSKILLGWDLPSRFIEACADECLRHDAQLILWFPLLTGHKSFPLDPTWRVIGLNGQPVDGDRNKPEFTFVCSNHPDARGEALRLLDAALSPGFFRGVFLDRIRFPSLGGCLDQNLSCFCQACHAESGRRDLDLPRIQHDLTRISQTTKGRKKIIQLLLGFRREETPELLQRWIQFRQQSINHLVKEAAERYSIQGYSVGLDCFSPTLADMVGQDLSTLTNLSDWIKVMTYVRAYGPASIPYELSGLVNYLMGIGDISETQACAEIAQDTGWNLPDNKDELRKGNLPALILTNEIKRGRMNGMKHLFAGMELVEKVGIACPSSRRINSDAETILSAKPDGVVLSWDLRLISQRRLRQVGSIFFR